MNNGGWEVVGKNKKDKNGTGKSKLSKTERKEFVNNSPKVEDFLPLAQVKTLYDNLDNNKENKKPPKGKENKTKENEDRKKQQKPQKQQQSEKKKEERKAKVPKSTKEALIAIDKVELQNLLTDCQVRFPDAPLIWLKNLVSFLNTNIPVDTKNPMFTGKVDELPADDLSGSVRLILENAIEMAGPLNAQLFYEYNLTAMTTDMSKGNDAVIGYKIFFQLLAKYNPTLATENIPKLVSLKNSYQNRKPICISLLWAIAQSGNENLDVGLKLLLDVMLPLLETKSYSNYVLQILDHFTLQHATNNKLPSDVYLNIVELFYKKLNIPVAYSKEVALVLSDLRTIALGNTGTNFRKFFNDLAIKLHPSMSKTYKDEVAAAMVGCLLLDQGCSDIWKAIHTEYTYASCTFLEYMCSHWNDFRCHLNLKLVIKTCESILASGRKGTKTKGKFEECLKILKDKHEQAMKRKPIVPREGGFPWKTGSFILLVLITSIVAYDTHKHGSFEESCIGKVLRDSGVTLLAQKTGTVTGTYLNKGLEYIESCSPEYYKAVVEFSTPYAKLARDAYIVSKNLGVKLYGNAITYVNTTAPVVVAKIEHYAPGLCDTIQQQTANGVSFVKRNSVLLAEQVVENSSKAMRWLETNVFVGKLSPENLHSYASQAINTTQAFASRTYDWVYEKVQTFSKVQ